MKQTLDTLLDRMGELEAQLQTEMQARAEALRYRVERRRVVFEASAREAHAALRQGLLAYLRGGTLRVVLTAPVIYAMIVPLVLLDLFVSLYQAVCFPVYEIEKVRRGDYIVFDRRYLSYLNGLEKLNCLYCSYANGLLAYAREIAGRTELRWCPIKHAARVSGLHRQYAGFVDYGDAEAYRALQDARASRRKTANQE